MSPRARRATLVPILAVVFAVSACGGTTSTTPTTSPAPPAGSTTPERPAGTPLPSPTPVGPAASPSGPPPAPLTLLWEKSGPYKVQTETYWPTINPVTGNIWVASSFDNQFWIFSPDGRFLEAWGAPGKGAGQFKLTTNDPNPDGVGAIAFLPDGSFYVADDGNARIERFDKNRHFLSSWGRFGTGDGQFTSPKGIATDGETVFVADDSRGDMQAFDLNGKFVRSFDFPFVLFTLAPTGHLFVPDFTGILELDQAGKQVAHIDLDYVALGGSPGQVAVDKAGHLFLNIQGDSGPVGLVELDPHGTILGPWSTGGETLTLAPDGSAVYIAETGPSNSGWPFIRKYALPKG